MGAARHWTAHLSVSKVPTSWATATQVWSQPPSITMWHKYICQDQIPYYSSYPYTVAEHYKPLYRRLYWWYVSLDCIGFIKVYLIMCQLSVYTNSDSDALQVCWKLKFPPKFSKTSQVVLCGEEAVSKLDVGLQYTTERRASKRSSVSVRCTHMYLGLLMKQEIPLHTILVFCLLCIYDPTTTLFI